MTAPLYILKFGRVFFLMWENFTTWPEWTRTRKLARRLPEAEADFIIAEIEKIVEGVEIEKVKVKS